MKVIFAASDALSRWVDIDLPHLRDDEKRFDKGLLVSDKNAVSWQCYLVPHGCVKAQQCDNPLEHGQLGADLIFIGAYSRYVIICPNIALHEPEEIEHEFISRLMAEIAQLMVTLGGEETLIEHCADTLNRLDVRYDWFQYSAPNMQARFLEAKKALKAFYAQHDSGQLTDELAYEIDLSLNTKMTRAQILTTSDKVDTFVPVERILGDWLIRFGDGAHALVREHEAGEMLRIINDSKANASFLTTKIKNLRASKVAPVDVYMRRKQISSTGET